MPKEVLHVYEAFVIDIEDETILFSEDLAAKDREQAMLKLDRALRDNAVTIGEENKPIDITNTWYVKVFLREVGTVHVY